ncbi:MAG: methyltransferase domain-containing protein [Candidatus Riflebacteria bacterium]|nr:methyltransferase domain-containing protein [Candidatus Riflebacteria bacterium]
MGKVKIDLASHLRSGAPVIVELGCGPNKRAGRIGIDRLELPGVDLVADVVEGLRLFPERSVDEVHSKSLLEHVDDLVAVMREIVRVLKPEGRSFHSVPHFSNPYFYSDYTHTRFMGLYTFYYFVDEEFQLRRKVPTFYSGVRIRVISQRLVFASSFSLLNRLKKLVERLVNATTWTQELYEETLCYLLPCYNLEVVFRAAPEDLRPASGA